MKNIDPALLTGCGIVSITEGTRKSLPPGSESPAGEAGPRTAVRRKYGNKPVNGYASTKEAKRASELALLEMAGKIKGLREQVRYSLIINDMKVCEYIADFEYEEAGVLVVEDVKSVATRKNRVYRLKLKLMRACYGIQIRET